jgi:hypothetical protein
MAEIKTSIFPHDAHTDGHTHEENTHMSITKRSAILAAVAALTIPLAACTSDDTDSDATTTTRTTSKTTSTSARPITSSAAPTTSTEPEADGDVHTDYDPDHDHLSGTYNDGRDETHVVAPAPDPEPEYTPAPEPAYTPEPAPVVEQPADSGFQYQNCTAVRNAGAAPIHPGDYGWGPHLDRDSDGVACDGD